MAAIVVIDEQEVDTGAAAVQVPALNSNVKSLVFYALESNTADIYLGNSSVATAGANRGVPMSPGDRGVIPVAGPGAREFWFISAAAQKVLVQQWG